MDLIDSTNVGGKGLCLQKLIKENRQREDGDKSYQRIFQEFEEGYILAPISCSNEIEHLKDKYVSETYDMSQLCGDKLRYAVYRITKTKPKTIRISYYRGPVNKYKNLDPSKIIQKHITGYQREYIRRIDEWIKTGKKPESTDTMIFEEKDFKEKQYADPYRYTTESNILERTKQKTDSEQQLLVDLKDYADIIYRDPSSGSSVVGKYLENDILIDMDDPENIIMIDDETNKKDLEGKNFITVRCRDNENADYIFMYLNSELPYVLSMEKNERLYCEYSKRGDDRDILSILDTIKVLRISKKNNFAKLKDALNHRTVEAIFDASAECRFNSEPETPEDVLTNDTLAHLTRILYALNYDMISEDYEELRKSYNTESFKCASTIAGSILEAICLDWSYQYFKMDSLYDEFNEIIIGYTKKHYGIGDYLGILKKNQLIPTIIPSAEYINSLRNRIHPRVAAEYGNPSKDECRQSIENLKKIIQYRFYMHELENKTI